MGDYALFFDYPPELIYCIWFRFDNTKIARVHKSFSQSIYLRRIASILTLPASQRFVGEAFPTEPQEVVHGINGRLSTTTTTWIFDKRLVPVEQVHILVRAFSPDLHPRWSDQQWSDNTKSWKVGRYTLRVVRQYDVSAVAIHGRGQLWRWHRDRLSCWHAMGSALWGNGEYARIIISTGIQKQNKSFWVNK